MLVPISARIADDLYRAIEAQVDVGCFPSRSQAVAYYLRAGLEADDREATLRRVLREELARLQPIAQSTPPTNPKRTRMLDKVRR